MKNFLNSVLIVFVMIFVSTLEAQNRARGGADSQDGWIIRRTERGIVKVPRRQKFRFEGSDVQGDVERPSQSVLGARVPRQNTSLIPVRSSFREEYLSVSGLPER